MGLITPKGKEIRVNISPNIDSFERGGKNAGFLCKVVLVGEEKGVGGRGCLLAYPILMIIPINSERALWRVFNNKDNK